LIPQDDPSWVPARVGKLTPSRMADAMDRLKNGQPSAKCKALLMDLVAERMTGSAKDHYVTPAMQHGLDFEAAAVEAYEVASGELAMPAGLFDHPKIEWFAATPDRLLGSDALIEIKCPTTQTYIGWRLAGVVPDEHKPQMLAQLACTGRRFVDFVAFDPRLPPKQQLFIRRFEPDAAEIAAIESAAREFLAEVEALFEKVTTA